MRTTLGDYIAEASNGFASGQRDDKGVIQLRMNNVTAKGALDLTKTIRVPAEGNIQRYTLKPGDILFNHTNSTELVGKTALFEGFNEEVVYSNHFTRLRVDEEVAEPAYVALFINHLWNQGYFRDRCQIWVGQSAVRFDVLARAPTRFPSLDDQRSLATRLKSQMAAVEETRRRVEEQAKAAAAIPTQLLKEIFQADETGEWPVRRVGDACDFLPARSINLKGTAAVRAVTTACLQETGFTSSGVKDALMMEDDVADALLSSGEILIARSNTPALVGRAALFEGSRQPLVASDLTIRLRARDGVEPAYAAVWFSYLFVTGYWQERASGASDTMKKIGRAQLAATDIPLPPLKTQRQIAARLREQFTHLQQLQSALSTQLEALDKLPGAFLREVFGSLTSD